MNANLDTLARRYAAEHRLAGRRKRHLIHACGIAAAIVALALTVFALATGSLFLIAIPTTPRTAATN